MVHGEEERGQATVVAPGMVAVLLTLVLALGRLGVHAVGRARIDGAADAVALAAAAGGHAAAERVAAANEVSVTRLEVGPGWARVTVRSGSLVASSAAMLTEDDHGCATGRSCGESHAGR